MDSQKNMWAEFLRKAPPPAGALCPQDLLVPRNDPEHQPLRGLGGLVKAVDNAKV